MGFESDVIIYLIAIQIYSLNFQPEFVQNVTQFNLQILAQLLKLNHKHGLFRKHLIK
jgi:hypothetical protein